MKHDGCQLPETAKEEEEEEELFILRPNKLLGEKFYRHFSRCYQSIMTTFILFYIVLCTRFVILDLLSTVSEISVSGPVGSTAVLPCELTSVDTDTLYIKWITESEIVFERLGEKSYHAGGYEGRVDVPVEELRKGNCSLVLHNLTFTDTGVYTSYQAVNNTNGSLNGKAVLINHVKLSVHNRTEESPDSSDNRGRNHHYLWILVLPVLVLLGLGVWHLKRTNFFSHP